MIQETMRTELGKIITSDDNISKETVRELNIKISVLQK